MGLSVGKIKDTDQYARLLIYGAPGVGKTTFAAQAPNPVIMDYENSSETLRNTDKSDTPVISDRKALSNFTDVIDFIRKPNEFDTIIIDSISSMNDTFLMEHMRSQKNRDKHIALFQDFRKMNNVLKEIFYEMITVPKNVVLVAHEKVLRNEDNKILEVRPQLPPGAEASIERLINEVYYMEVKPNLRGPSDRILHVDSQGKILAKNRMGLTENKLINPTWKEIFNG